MTDRRLIESAFPLKQTSLDSVHEKNVRHGHISTLHIWPARRPLAACRAALLATLLPDPETAAERQALCERIGGKVRKTVKQSAEVEETVGGILHWGRERENAAVLDELRQRIRAAFGGQAPKVLDPFAGGGAIPLEAMRLGCEVTAADLNPVAWFILKCTLEYPQKLAGQTRPLPAFILEDRAFMAGFFQAQGLSKAEIKRALEDLGHRQAQQTLTALDLGRASLEADLAWHVRAWGQWVLAQARRELARFYPTYAEFMPLKPGHVHYEKRPLRLVPLTADGLPDLAALNAEFAPTWLADEKQPRWVAKPTVAYLWARTVPCKGCRATLPLLKTRWLAKKDNKRVVLTLEVKEIPSPLAGEGEGGGVKSISDSPHPNLPPQGGKGLKGVVFGIETGVPARGKTAGEKKEHDKALGAGTMSRSGAKCPCCGVLMTMEDIRFAGRQGQLGAVMTAVVVDGLHGKEYRLPTAHEIEMAEAAGAEIERVFQEVPFGVPEEPTPKGGSGAARAFSVDGYGFDQWWKLFTPRQLMSLGVLLKTTHSIFAKNHEDLWIKTIKAYLAIALDRLISFACVNVRWKLDAEAVVDAFARFALPIMWDFAEPILINNYAGSYLLCYERIALALQTLIDSSIKKSSNVINVSVIKLENEQQFDSIITDPPYYDAIPYADLMDFFYIWLRRTLHGLSPEIDEAFARPLSPKWNHDANDGELIDDASRFNGDKAASKRNYEDGMARAFQACHAVLAQVKEGWRMAG
jgi:adenine-specific DNA methylase